MGYVYAFIAFLTIGSYMVPVRFATAKGLDFMPFMGAGMVLFCLAKSSTLAVLWSHPAWFWASVGSGVLWVLGQGLANMALEEISLAKASVFLNFNSFINILIGLFLFHEAQGSRAYLMVLAGGILLFLGAWWVARISASPSKEGNLLKGLVLSVLAGIFWGVYFAPIKAAQVWAPQAGLNEADALCGLALGGAVPPLLTAFFRKGVRWTGRNVGWGLTTAALWAVGMTSFLSAIHLLGLSRAVPIVNSSTLVYTAWSILVFKEIPLSQWPKVLGGTLLVVAGVVLMAFTG